MVALTDKESIGKYGFWDLVYFIFFNRWLQLFDVPTLLIIFIEGRSWYRKSIARVFVLHAIFRNIGAILWAIITFAMQHDKEYWRYNTSIPTMFWYLGELLLDSYPLQKALALAPIDPKFSVLRILPIAGFIPCVIAKVGAVVFRYTYTRFASTSDEYFTLFNVIDAGVILATTLSDICSCVVIIYVGVNTLRRRRRHAFSFTMDFVTTTELRMFACRCSSDVTGSNCTYAGARDLAINYVYILYYLDYLILKFHNAQVAQTINLGNNVEKVALSQWPNLGQYGGARNTLNATTTESGPGLGGTGFITSENESPSLRIMRQGAQSKGGKRSVFGMGMATSSSQFASDESMGGGGVGVGYPPTIMAQPMAARAGNVSFHAKWTQMTSTTPAVSIDESESRP
ncbi:hypothetical protein BJ742DRAFT_808524 [Cladochytrium replicatum]|nr:hypothetical protein BJ742DRAFT_808524 [Cladochytrium replicatum]